MFLPNRKVPLEWPAEQVRLARLVVVQPFVGLPRFIAGADIAFSLDGSHAQAAAVVYDRVEKRIIEQAVARRPVEYPYVPGYLSFREGPVLLEVIASLKHPWDVIMFDGQGICHPRRCGLAAHMGVTLDRPAIGAAKSRLCGEHREPGLRAGSASSLMLDGERVGLALRTRDGVKPLYVSIGHRMDLPSAKRITLACCQYRLPEPTRQADILSKRRG